MFVASVMTPAILYCNRLASVLALALPRPPSAQLTEARTAATVAASWRARSLMVSRDPRHVLSVLIGRSARLVEPLLHMAAPVARWAHRRPAGTDLAFLS